jgi:nicotinamidase-related amidase
MDRLRPESSLLLVVDVQERLASAMPEAGMEKLVANTTILLEAARLLGIAVAASEQYPKGLGPTVPALAMKLREIGLEPVDKVSFDACSEPRIGRLVAARAPRSVVVTGMEAHICVFQTARELVRLGYETFVVADAVCSRRDENREVGLRLCERAGAFVTTTETVAFDWLSHAGTEPFKAISKLVR